MAAPAFRSRSQVSGTATGLTGTEPAGATTDDILLAVAYTETNSATFVPPTGWSSDFGPATALIEQLLTTPDTWEAHAYWIRRGGSAPSYAFNFTTSAYCEVVIAAYSGAYNSGDPWSFAADTSRNSASAGTPLPDISGTTDTADELLIFAGITFVGGNLTGPTGFTARASGGHDTQLADKAQAAAGATGTVTGATVSTGSSNAASFLFGLRSAAAPGAPLVAKGAAAASGRGYLRKGDGGLFLLEDGTSHLLLEDGTSSLQLEDPGTGGPLALSAKGAAGASGKGTLSLSGPVALSAKGAAAASGSGALRFALGAKGAAAGSGRGTLTVATLFIEPWTSIASTTSRNGDAAVSRWTVGRAQAEVETLLMRVNDGDWAAYRTGGGANTNAPPGDVQVSTTANMVQIACSLQNYGETQLWALPKLNFGYFDGVQVKVDLPAVVDKLQGYPTLHIADRHYSWIGLYDDNGKSGLAQYGLSIQFTEELTGLRVKQSNNSTETELTPTTQNTWTSGVRNLRLKLTTTRLEVYDLTGSTVLWEGAHDLGFTTGHLGLGTHNHASNKYDGVWGNDPSRKEAVYYRFGEVRAAIDSRADTIVGQTVNAHGTADTAGNVEIAYAVPTSGMTPLAFSLSSLGTSAHLTGTIKCDFGYTGTIDYRFNGGTWTACTLYTANTTDLSVRLISQSAPLTDLVSGSNTVEFRSTSPTGYGPWIVNVDVFTWDLSNAIVLAGEGAVAASGKGTLTLSTALSSKGAAAASGKGTLSLSTALQGKGAAAASGRGTLSVGALGTAKGAAAASGAGTLRLATALTGKGTAAASGRGTLSLATSLQAKGAAASSGSGVLSLATSLQAKGAAAASARGTLTISTAGVLVGKGAAAGSAVGTLSVAQALSAEGAAAASATGTLGLSTALVGRGAAAASGRGTVTFAGSTVSVAGKGAAAGSAKGTLSLTTALVGRGAASASGTGTLGLRTALVGKGAAAASGRGQLAGATLAGRGAAAASGKGTLSVRLALVGRGAASAGASATLGVRIALQGKGAAAASGRARMAVDVHAGVGSGSLRTGGSGSLRTASASGSLRAVGGTGTLGP